METLVAILAIVNLLLLVAVVILVISLRSRPTATADVGPIRQELQMLGSALLGDQAAQRQELRDALQTGQHILEQRISDAGRSQAEELGRERLERAEALKGVGAGLAACISAITERIDSHARTSTGSLNEFRQSFEGRFDGLRKDSDTKLEQIRGTVDEKLQGTLTTSLRENALKIEELAKTNSANKLDMQTLLSTELEKLRAGNEAKLEKMRETVDEKLQGTLERRLGESFPLVSDRLEQVQKGLGEMQTLASGVGGLKRVLTNVKNRGGWGEVQLSRQLEDILTPGQYEQNVVIKSGTQERVEFAVKLPGRGDEVPVSRSSRRRTTSVCSTRRSAATRPRSMLRARALSAPSSRRLGRSRRSTSIPRAAPISQSCTSRLRGCSPGSCAVPVSPASSRLICAS